MDDTARLCADADVPEGQARGFAEHRVFVVRQRGQLHAWRDACPHYGDTPLAWRQDAYLNADATRIVCAAHGAQFDPATGVCLLGPCLGQSLTRVPLTVASDGGLDIDIHIERPHFLKEPFMTTDPTPGAVRHALVIGGGFAGMSAAIRLRKHGVAVDLVELDPGWRSYGAGISLGGPTLRALRDLGLLDAFFTHGYGSDGVDLFLPHGQLLSQLPTPRLAGAEVQGAGAIMRPALAKLMAEATRLSGTNVRLGCSFTAVQQDAEGVEVSFTDGSTSRYDVVIAADGLYSKVRTLLFPEAPKPRYTGQGVWRAVLPRPPELLRATMWMGGAVKPGVNPVSESQMYLFVTENRAENAHVPPAEQPEFLRALLAPFPAPMLQSIRAQIDGQAQVIYRPLQSMLLPRPWYAGRVVLIGDAVHATTPHLASGACIGIEDGLVLADELVGASTVEAGLERFQARRWERCRMVVENSGRLGEIEVSGGDKAEHARVMRESMMALAEPI